MDIQCKYIIVVAAVKTDKTDDIAQDSGSLSSEENMAPPEGQVVRCKARPREYKSGEDFKLYLNHFNRVAAANQWSDEIKLVQLETTLKGKAQREFEVFIEETPNITWEQMTTKLKIELAPSTQMSLDDFGQMRLDGRSPKEFYGVLVRQSKVAHGEMPEEARHVVVRAQMLMVLPKKLRMDASKQQDLTGLDKEAFLDLLTRVYGAELKEEVEEKHYEPIVHQVQAVRQDTIEARIKKLEETSATGEKDMAELKSLVKELCIGMKQERGQSTWNLENVTCYRCREKGHLAKNCKNEKVCGSCKATGHTYSECKKNPKNA